MKKNNTWWIVGVVFIVIIGLLVWPKFKKENREFADRLEDLGIDCLAQGHVNLGQHIHPNLMIFVDESPETIPSNIGITSTCMAELHTHDTTGKIHLETIESTKEFKLKDFMTLAEIEIDREGYDLIASVDGVPRENIGEVTLADEQVIELRYTKKTNSQ